MPRHRFRRALLVALVSSVLLEAVLQVLAFGAYLLQRAPTPVMAGGASQVLCIGDSFTYGDGATAADHSYPLAMQRLLAERHGVRTEVANAGWRGQDSREALATLRARLKTSTPRVVCVLSGANDRWNRPALLPAEAAEDGARFRFRWRTARLVALLWGGFGALHDQRDGGASGPSDAMVEVARRLVREAGVVPGKEPAEWPRPPEPAQRGPIEAARAAIARGDHEAAVAGLTRVLEQAPGESVAHLMLVEAHTRRGARDRALAVVATMRQARAAEPSLANTQHLVDALWEAGETDEALRLAGEAVVAMPRAAGLWKTLAVAEFRRDEVAAGRAYRRYLELVPQVTRWDGNYVAGLGRCLAATEPASSARLLAAGLLLQGGLQRNPWACYQIATRKIPAATMEAVLEPAGLDARGRELLRTAFDEVYGTAEKAWLITLRAHLEAMAGAIHAAGARPVFASYPFWTEQNDVLREVAAECGAEFVATRDRFEQELKTRSRQDLFVADGHCNDAGYAIMAEEIGAAVARLLAR